MNNYGLIAAIVAAAVAAIGTARYGLAAGIAGGVVAAVVIAGFGMLAARRKPPGARER